MKPRTFPLFAFSAALLLFCTHLTAQPKEWNLNGTMTAGAKKLALTMTLTKEGTQLSGSYRYVSQGADIMLVGIVGDGGNAVIEEFAEKSKRTGIFNGTLSASGFEGTWSSPDGKKRLPVSLKTANESSKKLSAQDVAGTYKRASKTTPAEITIKALPDGSVAVKGEALWIGSKDNVHTGTLDGNFALQGAIIIYSDKDSQCKLTLEFKGETLVVTGDGANGSCGGMNVTFDGTYKRVSTKNLKKR